MRWLFVLLKFICRSHKWIFVYKKVYSFEEEYPWGTKYERRIVILKERYLEENNLSRGKKSCSSGNVRRVPQKLFWSNEYDSQFIIFPSVFQTQNYCLKKEIIFFIIWLEMSIGLSYLKWTQMWIDWKYVDEFKKAERLKKTMLFRVQFQIT